MTRKQEAQKDAKEQRKSNPESKITIILAITSIIVSFFFFPFGLTGNVVSTSASALREGNIFGVVFFLLGVLGVFFYARGRK